MDITKFKPGEGRLDCFNMLIVAKKYAGKSVLIRDVIYNLHRKGVPRCVVFSATEGSNGFYKGFIPDSYVYNEFNPDVFDRVVDHQINLTEKQKMGELGEDVDLRIIIVLDDCGFDRKALNSKAMRYCYMNGRHAKIILIMAVQFCLDIKPELRTQVDYVVCFKDTNIKSTERLYNNFFGIFENVHVFRKVLSQTTENYGCLVLDNTRPSNTVEDVIRWYRAKERDFQFGSPDAWKYHEKRYLSEKERYKRKKKQNANASGEMVVRKLK
jgi:hypothetical protein